MFSCMGRCTQDLSDVLTQTLSAQSSLANATIATASLLQSNLLTAWLGLSSGSQIALSTQLVQEGYGGLLNRCVVVWCGVVCEIFAFNWAMDAKTTKNCSYFLLVFIALTPCPLWQCLGNLLSATSGIQESDLQGVQVFKGPVISQCNDQFDS